MTKGKWWLFACVGIGLGYNSSSLVVGLVTGRPWYLNLIDAIGVVAWSVTLYLLFRASRRSRSAHLGGHLGGSLRQPTPIWTPDLSVTGASPAYPQSPETELVASSVMAWRGFLPVVMDGLLQGMRRTWHSADQTAVCHNRHTAPQWDCSCGIYALKNMDNVKRSIPFGLMASPMGILAEVRLWGRIIEHEKGYRAEKAKIVRLIIHPSLAGLMGEKLERNYYPARVELMDLRPDKWT